MRLVLVVAAAAVLSGCAAVSVVNLLSSVYKTAQVEPSATQAAGNPVAGVVEVATPTLQ